MCKSTSCYKHIVPTGLERVSNIDNSLTLHPTNTKRVFGVDLDECHTRIHIVDLWVERSETRSTTDIYRCDKKPLKCLKLNKPAFL